MNKTYEIPPILGDLMALTMRRIGKLMLENFRSTRACSHAAPCFRAALAQTLARS
jgi:hypothetical protein